ncbi:MAG: CoA transferase [Desertimonas sp.]
MSVLPVTTDAPGVALHRRVFERPSSPGDRRRWLRSGAAGLSGPFGGPAALPAVSLATTLIALEREITAATPDRPGTRPGIVELLGERAAVQGWRRSGRRSLGGVTRLVPAADGWLAIALARPDDIASIPAWLGTTDVDQGVGRRCVASLVAAGAELGLAVAGLGEVTPADGPAFVVGPGVSRRPLARWADVTVVDLSSLWAGPLCTSLLGSLGARVIKVESTRRPDGARRGPPVLFDLLHVGQESVAFDFDAAEDRRRLRALIAHADVVVEASRPRALAQIGVDAEAFVRHGIVWLSITGHGRRQPMRVAFGDDAAVAGGLVTGGADRPWFCADAVADPLSGVLGAAAIIDRLTAGVSGLIDLSMAAAAAWAGRSGPDDDPVVDAAPPRIRPSGGPAPALGADTVRVLRELGIG